MKHCKLHEEISEYKKDRVPTNYLMDGLIKEYEAFYGS